MYRTLVLAALTAHVVASDQTTIVTVFPGSGYEIEAYTKLKDEIKVQERLDCYYIRVMLTRVVVAGGIW